MRKFIECVKSVEDKEIRIARQYKLTYAFCDPQIHPNHDQCKGIFGGEERVKNALSLLYSHVEHSFWLDNFAVDINHESPRNGEWTKPLLAYLAKDIAACNIAPPSELKFDGSKEDMQTLWQCVQAVSNLKKRVQDCIAGFYQNEYGTAQADVSASFLKLSSKLLHGYFPQSIMPFDIDLHVNCRRIFLADKCAMGDYILPKDMQRALFDEDMRVFNSFPKELLSKADPDEKRYAHCCARIYALCEYLTKNIADKKLDTITLAVLLCASVSSIRTDKREADMKRIFAYVQNNVRKHKPSVFYAVSEDGKHYFERAFEGDLSEYTERNLNKEDTLPAARTFAEFADFCAEECGIDTDNISVVFAEGARNNFDRAVSAYLALWLIPSCEIEGGYRVETLRKETPPTFKQFKRACDIIGLPEPYETKRLYEEYEKQFLHDGAYSAQELDRMESYVKTHLALLYRKQTLKNFGKVLYSIPTLCAEICSRDRERFYALMNYVIDDYKRRKFDNKQTALSWVLRDIAGKVFFFGGIDYADIDGYEKQPPMNKEKYKIYIGLTPENFKIVKEIIEAE